MGEGRASAAHIAEMQRQMKYEKRRPKYYEHLARKYAMVDDTALAHSRNINWTIGWALYGSILLFVVAGIVYSCVSDDALCALLIIILAAVLCALVTYVLMEPANEIRRRALVRWRAMMTDVTYKMG